MVRILPGKDMAALIRNSISCKDDGQQNMIQMARSVRLEWVQSKWKGTALKKESERFEAIQLLKKYFTPIKCWASGTLYQALLAMQTRWIPGRIFFTITKPKNLCKKPDRGLADMFHYWISDLMNSQYNNSLELMLSISLFLGWIAFWELAPHHLLEVEPNLILDPNKIKLFKQIIMHQGCEILNMDDGHICTCTQDPVHNMIAEEFQQKSGITTEPMRRQGRTTALAISVTSIVIGILLNAVATSHLTV